jgi:glycosyltransferase involved in cell wall biosynthesis
MRHNTAVVIPCLNEAPNLEVLLPKIKRILAETRIPAEVYVIDGNSTDETVSTARRLGAHVIPQRGRGYGGAIKTAFEDIDATYLITIDADGSHPPSILKYLYAARHDAEIIIASRWMSQGYAEMPFSRWILSRILNAVFRIVLCLPFFDLSSGYRLYNKRAVANLCLRMTSYAILQEILVRAYCFGYAIKEIPLHYFPRLHGKSHARLWKFGKEYLHSLYHLWVLRNSIASADYDTRAFFSRIPMQRFWQRKRYRILRKYIGDSLRVLDTSCGSSQLLNGMPQIVGMDILPGKLRFMRAPGRSLVQASVYDIPFRNDAFEVVVSSQTIEHIRQDEKIFRELARCVEPGGVLIVGTVDYGSWQWPVIEKLYKLFKPQGYADEHISHYTRASLQQCLSEAGMVVEDVSYILGGEIIVKARKTKPVMVSK